MVLDTAQLLNMTLEVFINPNYATGLTGFFFFLMALDFPLEV